MLLPIVSTRWPNASFLLYANTYKTYNLNFHVNFLVQIISACLPLYSNCRRRRGPHAPHLPGYATARLLLHLHERLFVCIILLHGHLCRRLSEIMKRRKKNEKNTCSVESGVSVPICARLGFTVTFKSYKPNIADKLR